MKSIYDMMGQHTYPLLREDAPLEHVERFFQVSAPAWQVRDLQLEDRGALFQAPLSKPIPSLGPPLPQGGQTGIKTAIPTSGPGLVFWCLPGAPQAPQGNCL